ncbi:MAG: HNH endonuclease signature motif containing protein, partial [Microthrixaceae bacterium]
VMTTKSAENAPPDADRSLSVSNRDSLAQQRAQAFLDLVTNEGASVSTEIVIHVRGDGTRLDDGTPIADHYIDQLLPQSAVRTMIHNAERHPINVSGKHRFPTRRQQLVVNERQPACKCGSTQFLHYHHEPPYEETQSTTLDGLQRLCGKCHRIRHSSDSPGDRPDHQADEPPSGRPGL